MIAFAVDSEFYQQRRLRRFLDAVENGAKVFAHPETVRQLEHELDRRGLRHLFLVDIKKCEYVEQGVIYAIQLPISFYFDLMLTHL